MREIIIAGDDEVDLCRQQTKRRGIKNITLLIGVILIVFIGIQCGYL